MTGPQFLLGYLAVGACYLIVGFARGLYRLDKHEVNLLHEGGGVETKQTRAVGEFIATIGLALVVWPIFPAFAAYHLVANPILRRRFERDRPTWRED